MKPILDDPIIRCIERTGYPPGIDADYEDSEDAGDDPGRKDDE